MAEFNNQKLIAVVGPTASGKTSLAIKIAKQFNGEIISMDSMQIYKYMSIGTAKPTVEEMDGIPHHMLDFVEPGATFTANDYAELARDKIAEITSRGKVPILCGGTGLYLNSVLYAYEMSEAAGDDNLRAELEKFAEENGNNALHDRLKVLDPQSAQEIHPNNVKRVVRALEICILTGKPRSEQMTAEPTNVYPALIFGMVMPRDELYDRINKRVDIMLEQGLLNEFEGLLSQGILNVEDKTSQASQAIGYKELLSYKRGEISLEEAIDQIKMNSRRYAKRQLTWFRRNNDILWLDPRNDENVQTALVKIESFLKG